MDDFCHLMGDECLLSFYGDWLQIVPGLGQGGNKVERLDSGISFLFLFLSSILSVLLMLGK